jgi:YHS domain-containing protein
VLSGRGSGEVVSDEMVKDPFCEVYIPKGQSIRARIGGTHYHFCSKECVKGFKKRRKESEKKG